MESPNSISSALQDEKFDLVEFIEDLLDAEAGVFRLTDWGQQSMIYARRSPQHVKALQENGYGLNVLRHGRCTEDIHVYFRNYESHKCCLGLVGGKNIRTNLRLVKSDSWSQSSVDLGIDVASPNSAYAPVDLRLSDEEYRAFKCALWCAVCPLLTAQKPPDDASSPSSSPEHQMAHNVDAPLRRRLSNVANQHRLDSLPDSKNNDATLISSEIMREVLRWAFGLNKHLEMYYVKLAYKFHRTKNDALILAEDLCYQLSLLEKNAHPYYNVNSFTSLQSYNMWRLSTRRHLMDLLNKFWSSSLPPVGDVEKFDARSIHSDYRTLLHKLLRQQKLQFSKDPSSATYSVVPSGASQRILTEFSLRYGIDELYHLAAYLEYLILTFGVEIEFISLVTQTVQNILGLLSQEKMTVPLVKQQVDQLQSCVDLLIRRCEHLFCHIQTVFASTNSCDSIGSLIHLLEEVVILRDHLDNSGAERISAGRMLQSYLEVNFQLIYVEHKSSALSDASNRGEQCQISPRVVNRIMFCLRDDLVDYRNNYQQLFERYFNITQLSSVALYDYLMNDFTELCQQLRTLAEVENVNFAMIGLIYRLNMLDNDLKEFIPVGKQIWRQKCVDLVMRWSAALYSKGEYFLLSSVAKDQFVPLRIPCKLTSEEERLQTRSADKSVSAATLRHSKSSAFSAVASGFPKETSDPDVRAVVPNNDSNAVDNESACSGLADSSICRDSNVSNNADVAEISPELNSSAAHHDLVIHSSPHSEIHYAESERKLVLHDEPRADQIPVVSVDSSSECDRLPTCNTTASVPVSVDAFVVNQQVSCDASVADDSGPVPSQGTSVSGDASSKLVEPVLTEPLESFDNINAAVENTDVPGNDKADVNNDGVSCDVVTEVLPSSPLVQNSLPDASISSADVDSQSVANVPSNDGFVHQTSEESNVECQQPSEEKESSKDRVADSDLAGEQKAYSCNNENSVTDSTASQLSDAREYASLDEQPHITKELSDVAVKQPDVSSCTRNMDRTVNSLPTGTKKHTNGIQHADDTSDVDNKSPLVADDDEISSYSSNSSSSRSCTLPQLRFVGHVSRSTPSGIVNSESVRLPRPTNPAPNNPLPRVAGVGTPLNGARHGRKIENYHNVMFLVTSSVVDVVCLLRRLIHVTETLGSAICHPIMNCQRLDDDAAADKLFELRSSLKKNLKEMIQNLIMLYAKNLLAMDLCAMSQKSALDLVRCELVEDLERSRELIWGCRHKALGTSCLQYVNRDEEFRDSRFEPLTKEMCFRVDNLRQMAKLLETFCQRADCVLSLSSDSTQSDVSALFGAQDYLNKAISGLINILVFRMQLFVSDFLEQLLISRLPSRDDLETNLQPLTHFLTNHLTSLNQWLCADNFIAFLQRFWMSMSWCFEKCALDIQKKPSALSEQYADRLLHSIIIIIQLITKMRLADPQHIEVQHLDSVLYWLQLYTQSSRRLISIYQLLCLKRSLESSDSSLPYGCNLETFERMRHDLHSSHKSFQGQQLVDWINCHPQAFRATSSQSGQIGDDANVSESDDSCLPVTFNTGHCSPYDLAQAFLDTGAVLPVTVTSPLSCYSSTSTIADPYPHLVYCGKIKQAQKSESDAMQSNLLSVEIHENHQRAGGSNSENIPRESYSHSGPDAIEDEQHEPGNSEPPGKSPDEMLKADNSLHVSNENLEDSFPAFQPTRWYQIPSPEETVSLIDPVEAATQGHVQELRHCLQFFVAKRVKKATVLSILASRKTTDVLAKQFIQTLSRDIIGKYPWLYVQEQTVLACLGLF